jgi:glycosyltransferase involved in cell wall biosynthesis
MKVSILVPAYNEVENIPYLAEELDKFMKNHKDYEVILIDDGSRDGTFEAVNTHRRNYLKAVRHKRNLGKTQAVLTGAAAAAGEILVIFDADVQFDLNDIPKLVALIDEKDADVATGWKQGIYEKKFVSNVYNWCSRKLFGLKVHDMNAIKAFKKDILQAIPLRKEWHRYIVPLAHAYGFRIEEIKVTLRPRKFGTPKYQQKSRIVVGLFDLLAVKFHATFMQKPLLYFGTIGMISALLGVAAGIVAIVLRIFGHGFRPLLYLVVLLVVSGILFFSLGLIGESIRSVLDRLEKNESAIR